MKEFFLKFKYRIVILGITIIVVAITLLIGGIYGDNEINGIRYQLVDNEYTVFRYYGDDEVVKIKSNFKGKKVTGIGEEAFHNNKNITKVILPKNLKVIEKNAFAGCIKLSELNLPDTVEVIEQGAFRNTLLYNIQLPKNVTVLNQNVLFTNNGIIEVPDTITIIGESAFQGNTNVEEIILPNTITSIGENAFWLCESLKKINLPDSIEYIGKDAFEQSGIEKITLPKNLTVIETDTFNKCDNLNEVILNEGLEIIKWGAFRGCHALKTINIPNTVIELGDECFGYSGLVKIVIPNSVEKIGINILCYCTSLKEISVPFLGDTKKNNKDIYYFFSGTRDKYNDPTSLEIVRVTGENVTIGSNAFAYSKTIKELYLESAVSIVEDAFESMELLEKVVINKLKNVGYLTFRKGRNVEKLELYCYFSLSYAQQYLPEDWYSANVNVHYNYNG